MCSRVVAAEREREGRTYLLGVSVMGVGGVVQVYREGGGGVRGRAGHTTFSGTRHVTHPPSTQATRTLSLAGSITWPEGSTHAHAAAAATAAALLHLPRSLLRRWHRAGAHLSR